MATRDNTATIELDSKRRSWLRRWLGAALVATLSWGTLGHSEERELVRLATKRLPPVAESSSVVTSSRRVARLPHVDGEEMRVTTPATPNFPSTGIAEVLEHHEPESLEVAWATAIAIDPWLDAKRSTSAAANSQWRAATAESYPWLDAGASYTVRDNQPGFVFSAPPLLPANTVFPYQQREGAGYYAAVTVPVYTGGGVPAAIDAAASSAAASELDIEVALQEIRLRVAEEYVAILRAASDLQLAQSTVRSLAAHAHDVEMLYAQEQRPKNDLLAAQVALADARQFEIAAANQLDISRAAYNRRLGRRLSDPVAIADLRVQRDLVDVDALSVQAIERREELAQLSLQASALSEQAESILARNRPQAAVTGGYVFNENQYQSPQGITSIGLGVSWNLYDAGRDRHRACALQQQAAALHRLRADLESRIRLDVRRGCLDVQQTLKRLQVTHAALAQADENVRVARGRYANEMVTNTDVLAAESLRLQSFRNHHHAYYDAVLARLRLLRTTGEL